MIDEEIRTGIRDAALRVLTGRERLPGDLPYPPTINEFVLRAAWPDEDPERQWFTKPGRAVTRAARQVYSAGFFAGRECDAQITRQLRAHFGDGPHPYVGIGACLVCDQAPHG